jgi:pimeloyl-ACP methyl ester carboxylesterase
MSSDGEAITLADGRRIGYGAVGPEHGWPVLYFHGCPGSRFDARVPGAEELVHERGIRMFVPERPGYGLSDRSPRRRVVDWAEDIRQFADDSRNSPKQRVAPTSQKPVA